MKKKIGILIGLSLMGLLVIAVIIMSLVQVNYKPEIGNPDSITIQTSNNKSTFISPGDETYNEIMKLFEQSFERSFISAFFAGQVNDNSTVIETNQLQAFSDYKMVFKYDENQTLNEDNEKYNTIIIGVSDLEEYQKVNVYYRQVASSSYYYLQTTFAKQNSLFEFLDTLTYYTD